MQTKEVEVLITVRRNVNGPVFDESNYEARVVENYPIGAKVTQVSASDLDNDEIRFRLVEPQEAFGFFYMNPLTGEISVTRLLTESTEKSYKVKMK